MREGEKVGVIVSNCVEWFVCANATHGLGGIFVPMYEKELQKVWQYIIQDGAIKYLFVRDQKIYDTVKSFQKNIPTLKDIFILFGEGENTLSALEKTGKANPAPSYKPHWSETAFIIYTSDTKVVIDKSRVGEDSPDGEIVVYGAQVMQGYHNKPAITKEAMMPDTWNGFPGVRTGDRGWLDEEGYLHITGRFKDEYKLDNGMMTQTLKLVRRNVMKKYGEQLKALYND